jgi:hypothetical protein
MKRRIALGDILILVGLVFFLIKPLNSLTGLAVAENLVISGGIWINLLCLVMIVFGLVLTLEKNLESEEESSHNLSHNDMFYWIKKKKDNHGSKGKKDRKIYDEEKGYINSKLNNRLRDMEEEELVGTDSYIPLGRYLTPLENDVIRDIILKHVPDELKQKGFEIALGGSLSSLKKGHRHNKERYKSWGIKNMLSDQFYLSDVDVGIIGKLPFDYIDANWNEVVKHDGRNPDEETYRVVDKEFLNEREKKYGYMNSAPKWVKEMLEDLSKFKFAGESRPVNIKFYKKDPGVEKEVIYKRD